MRRLLILSFSLVALMVLAYVQPPVHAQSNEYWAMPVEWIGSYNTSETEIFVDSFSGVNVPNGNTLVGWFNYQRRTAGPNNFQGMRIESSTVMSTSTSGNLSFNSNPFGQSNCVVRGVGVGLTTICNQLRSTGGVDANLSARSLVYNVTGQGLADSYLLSGITDGMPVSVDLYMLGTNGGGTGTRVGVLGLTHLIFYGVPPVYACIVADPTGGTAPLTVSLTDCSTPEEDVETWGWYIDDVFYSNAQNPGPYEFTEPGTYLVKLVINDGEVNEDEETVAITVHAPEGLVRPFKAVDEGATIATQGGLGTSANLIEGFSFADSSFFANSSDVSVVGFSNKPAIVHAADDGTVTAITPVSSTRCNAQDEECYVIFDTFKTFGVLEDKATAMSFNLNNVYMVTVEVEVNRHLRYLVTNPQQYVAVGDTVGKGCPLGESIPISKRYIGASEFVGPIVDWFVQTLLTLGLGINTSDIEPLYPLETAEFTVVQQAITISGSIYLTTLLPSLIEYPESEPRSCEYQPSACLSADPELKRPELWASTGNVEWFSGGGAVLNPGSRIDMQLALDSGENYTIETWARAMSGAGRISVQLGQTLTTFTPQSQFQQFIIPSGSHVPDLGLFYTLSISNTGSAPVFVQSVCVRDENNGSSRPPVCYFSNPSFDGLPAAQGWNTTGTVNDGLIPGEIIMFDGDTISQNAQLYPDGISAHVYFVTVTATVGGADITTLKADNTSEVGFEYEFPAAAGFDPYFGPNSADTYPVSGFFTGVDNGITFLPDNQIVFYANLTVSSFENSTFTIRAVIDSSNPNLFVRVREVCIDDPFLHHDDPDAWIPEPPFQPNCVGISPPQGNDVGAWTFYHWSQLDRFFQCDLMILLNRMHDTAQNAYRLMGWQFRYWQATLLMFTRWLSTDLIHWLNGHFRNMAVGSVTTIESAPGASLWDVLLALINVVLGPIVQAIRDIITMLLGIVSQVVNLVLVVIQGIISLIMLLLTQMLNLFGLAQSFLVALVTAYNTATPTPLPGMADCTANPQANAWCKSLWVLSNTIYSGPGALIIPLMTAILSIHLLLFVVGEFKRAVISIGQSS